MEINEVVDGMFERRGYPQGDSEVAHPQPANGIKCARCHRGLKTAYMVGGTAYGPICVRKLGFVVESNGVASRQRKQVSSQPEPDEGVQLTFFHESPTPEVVYTGTILGDDDDRIVTAHRPGRPARQLPLHLDIVNHSPTGFCWGYGGSGPAQLSLAVLLDYLRGDKERALRMYQDFKFKVIARFDQNKPFTLEGRTVENFITEWDINFLRREL